LTPQDIAQLDYRNTVFFDNNYYYINKVGPYDIHKFMPTEVELVKAFEIAPYVASRSPWNINTNPNTSIRQVPTPNQSAWSIVNGTKNQVNIYGQSIVVNSSNVNVGQGAEDIMVSGSDNSSVWGNSYNVAMLNSPNSVVMGNNITLINSPGVVGTSGQVWIGGLLYGTGGSGWGGNILYPTTTGLYRF